MFEYDNNYIGNPILIIFYLNNIIKKYDEQ